MIAIRNIKVIKQRPKCSSNKTTKPQSIYIYAPTKRLSLDHVLTCLVGQRP